MTGRRFLAAIHPAFERALGLKKEKNGRGVIVEQGRCPKCGSDLDYECLETAGSSAFEWDVSCGKCGWSGVEVYTERYVDHMDVAGKSFKHKPGSCPGCGAVLDYGAWELHEDDYIERTVYCPSSARAGRGTCEWEGGEWYHLDYGGAVDRAYAALHPRMRAALGLGRPTETELVYLPPVEHGTRDYERFFDVRGQEHMARAGRLPLPGIYGARGENFGSGSYVGRGAYDRVFDVLGIERVTFARGSYWDINDWDRVFVPAHVWDYAVRERKSLVGRPRPGGRGWLWALEGDASHFVYSALHPAVERALGLGRKLLNARDLRVGDIVEDMTPPERFQPSAVGNIDYRFGVVVYVDVDEGAKIVWAKTLDDVMDYESGNVSTMDMLERPGWFKILPCAESYGDMFRLIRRRKCEKEEGYECEHMRPTGRWDDKSSAYASLHPRVLSVLGLNRTVYPGDIVGYFDKYREGRRYCVVVEVEVDEDGTRLVRGLWDSSIDRAVTRYETEWVSRRVRFTTWMDEKMVVVEGAYKERSAPAGKGYSTLHPRVRDALRKKEEPVVEVWDNGGRSADRYAVIIGDDVYAMSENAMSPNGVNMYVGELKDLPGARDGVRVSLDKLPEAVRKAIVSRIAWLKAGETVSVIGGGRAYGALHPAVERALGLARPRFVSGSWDGTVKVWDAVTLKELETLSGHEGNVLSLAWSPDGRRFVSGSSDGTVKVWDAGTLKELETLKGHEGNVLSLAWSPDGRRFLSGSDDGTVKVWDAVTLKVVETLKGHTNSVESLAWSPDGRRFVSGSADDTIKVWDAGTLKEVETLTGHDGGVWSLAWGPDGRRFVSGSWDGTVKGWEARTWNV